jgi:hypothetical protein
MSFTFHGKSNEPTSSLRRSHIDSTTKHARSATKEEDDMSVRNLYELKLKKREPSKSNLLPNIRSKSKEDLITVSPIF